MRCEKRGKGERGVGWKSRLEGPHNEKISDATKFRRRKKRESSDGSNVGIKMIVTVRLKEVAFGYADAKKKGKTDRTWKRNARW